MSIKQLDQYTSHKLSTGQLLPDTCQIIKELVENSLDAGANHIGMTTTFVLP
jgi:DNA mismatch repair ATPase MutL